MALSCIWKKVDNLPEMVLKQMPLQVYLAFSCHQNGHKLDCKSIGCSSKVSDFAVVIVVLKIALQIVTKTGQEDVLSVIHVPTQKVEERNPFVGGL